MFCLWLRGLPPTSHSPLPLLVGADESVCVAVSIYLYILALWWTGDLSVLSWDPAWIYPVFPLDMQITWTVYSNLSLQSTGGLTSEEAEQIYSSLSHLLWSLKGNTCVSAWCCPCVAEAHSGRAELFPPRLSARPCGLSSQASPLGAWSAPSPAGTPYRTHRTPPL